MTSSTLPRPAAPGLSRRRRLLVLAICCASILIVVMDISIVNVALPAIRRDLRATEAGLQWTIDAYTLVLASFLVLAGSIADRVGRRRVFLVGLAAFGLGSLLCGLAPGIGWLIAARVVQAAGATMLNPVALAIVASTFPGPAGRARAIGVFGSVSGLALALGPILGGIAVADFGWRLVFWVNVPIVVAAIACTARFVPESRAARPRRPDLVGQGLVIAMLGGVVFAIIESGRLGWGSPVIVGLLAVAAIAALGIGAYEPRREDPLLDLRLFRSLPFSAAIAMALFALCGFGAFLFVTTQYLQEVRGMSALAAGLCLLPVGVVVVLVSPRAGHIVATRGPRLPLAVAGIALALGGGAAAGLRPPPRWRPCWRCTCCSASSWAPSTRRSPIPRSPGCPARWRRWRPRWPPLAGRPAPRSAWQSPGPSSGPRRPAARWRSLARRVPCGGWCSRWAWPSWPSGWSAPGAGPRAAPQLPMSAQRKDCHKHLWSDSSHAVFQPKGRG